MIALSLLFLKTPSASLSSSETNTVRSVITWKRTMEMTQCLFSTSTPILNRASSFVSKMSINDLDNQSFHINVFYKHQQK